MSDISLYSTTALTNGSANLANGVDWRENQAASSVNNSARQMMADLRGTFEGPDSKDNGLEWWNSGLVPTRTGNTTFTVPTDQTAKFVEGRRLRLTDSATIYATVVSSAYASVTTVPVATDSGNLSASLSAVYLSPQMPTNTSAPANFNKQDYVTTGGTSTAYTLTHTPKLTSLLNGAHGRMKIHTASGATPTLAIDGQTAKTIVKPGNVAIAALDLAQNAVLGWTYDSTLDKVVIEGLSAAQTGLTGSLITADPNPAVKDTLYGADTTAAAFTITMPASPGNGDKFYFDDAGGTWNTKNLTIDPNGNTINGVSGTMACAIQYASFGLVFWTGRGYRMF